jgi:N-acetylmuramoyl-L-alanine amidase
MIRTLQLLFFFIISPFFLKAQEKKKTVQTIIIDPGHGGLDPGAPGTFSTEAQVSLQVGLKLGKKLEEELPSIKILFTRTTDVMAGNKTNRNDGNRYRADFANQSGADLFISIHCNSAGRKPGGWYERRVAGYETKESYIIKKKKKVKVTKRIPVYENVFVPNKAAGTETFIWAAHENNHKESMVNTDDLGGEQDSTITFDENDPVLQAYRLLYTKKFFKNSVMLAEMVEDEFGNAGRVSRVS